MPQSSDAERLRIPPIVSPDRFALDELRIDRTVPRRGGLSAALMVAGVVVVAGGAGSWFWYHRPRAEVVRTIVVHESSTNDGRTRLNASGYVTARREATVSSKITGKVTEVLVDEGMTVESGQVLARIDSSNVEKSLHLSEAQLESSRQTLGETQAQLDQARREVKRIASLAEKRLASPVELDRAQTEARALESRLAKQTADIAVGEREVALWKQQLDDAIIRAPFGGVVTAKNAQPGEMISPMSVGGFTRTGICTIVDMSSLEIEVDVNESYINRVEPGQPVEATLDSYPDWRIPARVIAIVPTADRQKATVKVRVGFEKLDARVLPQMSVKVAFQSGSASGPASRSVTIPRSAVRRVDGRDVVWLVRDGRVERRAVQAGEGRGDEARIIAGLADGDRVVVEGADDLSDGARVTEAKR